MKIFYCDKSNPLRIQKATCHHCSLMPDRVKAFCQLKFQPKQMKTAQIWWLLTLMHLSFVYKLLTPKETHWSCHLLWDWNHLNAVLQTFCIKVILEAFLGLVSINNLTSLGSADPIPISDWFLLFFFTESSNIRNHANATTKRCYTHDSNIIIYSSIVLLFLF